MCELMGILNFWPPDTLRDPTPCDPTPLVGPETDRSPPSTPRPRSCPFIGFQVNCQGLQGLGCWEGVCRRICSLSCPQHESLGRDLVVTALFRGERLASSSGQGVDVVELWRICKAPTLPGLSPKPLCHLYLRSRTSNLRDDGGLSLGIRVQHLASTGVGFGNFSEESFTSTLA